MAYGASPMIRPGRAGFRIVPLLLFGIIALFYILNNRSTVPVTGRSQVVGMSEDQEMALGLQSYREVLGQSDVVRDGPEVSLLRTVGQRLAKATGEENFQWEFNLLRSPDANAFCLPGGKVAVYTGILPVAANADGLAVILGHEIAHATAHHGSERMAHQQLAQFGQLALGMASSEMSDDQRRAIMGAFGLGAQFGVLLPFSRKHESEADRIGLTYMARACFDLEEAPRFWERMQGLEQRGRPPEFLSTHPGHERRIENLRSWLPEAYAERQKYCP
jgi:metalloendopeptidase OMA1, mitochondrial